MLRIVTRMGTCQAAMQRFADRCELAEWLVALQHVQTVLGYATVLPLALVLAPVSPG